MKAMIELSDKKKQLLETNGHILVLGGPGSGKTTIALLKAKQIIESGIQPSQRVLFLSFARATVSRIAEHVGALITEKSTRNHLEINTYHGFIWSVLKAHGYLINHHRTLRLLSPPEVASRLANFTESQDRMDEKYRLLEQEGIIDFDLFAPCGTQLLSRSRALSAIISDSYPVVIVDEFQDTNTDEWKFIQCLANQSILVALADADQRIYEFRGADPARIGEFISRYHPAQFDFGTENNRSNGTDIVEFGNDLLTGLNVRKNYKNVHYEYYPFRKGVGLHADFKITVLKAIRRVRESGNQDWSLAVLVPSKRLMLEVSDYLTAVQTFSNNKKLPRIVHEVALETSGPALASIMVAGLLEAAVTKQDASNQLISDLCNHIRGRNGSSKTSRGNLELADALFDYTASGKIRGSKRGLIVKECNDLVQACRALEFTGNPSEDWLQVTALLSQAKSDVIKQVDIDVKYLRLLHKGSELSSNLADLWKTSGDYRGASQSVKAALLQEHFSLSTRVQKGVHVMTIHKSKGKEFDEVIIYDGRFHGKIVRADAEKKGFEQARLSLRVGVTRAKSNCIILTPADDVCRFLRE